MNHDNPPAPPPPPHPASGAPLQAANGLERLQAGELVAEIAPDFGGALAALYRPASAAAPRHDWLRPADAAALAAGSPLGMASFPLVPWCNRIRDGRFEWNGRSIDLGPNQPGSAHTIHGIGWLRPWQVRGRGASWIELGFDEPGQGAWPFPFQALQRYELGAEGLDIALQLRNTGVETMPAGLGHHPYFPHRREGPGTVVQAQVGAMWLSDSDLLPTALSTSDPAVAALRRGMTLARFDLDNNFTGFGHRAHVDWPDGSGLDLIGESPLDSFVLYSPSTEDVFVIEAVSNCTDWVNLRGRSPHADIGGAALAPGETLSARVRFAPRPG